MKIVSTDEDTNCYEPVEDEIFRGLLAVAEARAEKAERERDQARADCAALREALRNFEVATDLIDWWVNTIWPLMSADHPGADLLAAFRAMREALTKYRKAHCRDAQKYDHYIDCPCDICQEAVDALDQARKVAGDA